MKPKQLNLRINIVTIGDIELQSNENSITDLSNLALGILEQDSVKDYLNTLKLTKSLKDSQTYYG